MSFEFFCKRLRRQWWSPQFDGKAVPCGRAQPQFYTKLYSEDG